eukprot:TRINITY_DN75520_c0_g1_i1.p1 TRINITY_DN75520_c0_g1~~TRINITY_DN75520_c0_g1_i1.p1  ORF type:complete len:324 (-),score=42.97 TRINITY_DN75520_c0_g1_i1:98-1069(-)
MQRRWSVCLPATVLSLVVSQCHSHTTNLRRNGGKSSASSRVAKDDPELSSLSLDMSYNVFHPEPLPAEAASTAPQPQNRGAHFLRIQKTGGTTFGEHIMRKFCGPESDTCKWASHIDWTTATDSWSGPVVTLLRDPVERTMSEFSFIRSKDGNYSCRQAQWDFRNFAWFNEVASNPDEDAAFDTYLKGYPEDPSRNRQALYLLGFKRMERGTPVPVYTYDWDADQESTLAQAKDHLDRLAVFGITDCFVPSMQAIARGLGWPEKDVVDMAQSTHSRQHRQGQSWRETLPQEKIARIEQINAVDMQLYAYAKQRFRERFGSDCA